MATILEFLGKDHDRLEELFTKIRRRANQDMESIAPFFAEFRTGLEQHIVWEESLLFPVFEDESGFTSTGPTAVMRLEHEQIKRLLAQMESAIAQGDKQIVPLCAALLEILTMHNAKEEGILYPWFDHRLSEGKCADLIAQMDITRAKT